MTTTQTKEPPRRRLVGYFEEFITVSEKPRGLGAVFYPVDLPEGQRGRPLGHAGRRELVLTTDFTLRRGAGGTRTYRASGARPMRVWTMLQMIEGPAEAPERTTNE